jgi:hypothetical protein
VLIQELLVHLQQAIVLALIIQHQALKKLELHVTITLSGTTSASFVTDILAANIPYVTAAVESNGTIKITHQTGGQLYC